MWSPCYNATADGWEPEVFHNKCDHKPVTVVLARANSWWIFGGKSTRPWNACENSVCTLNYLDFLWLL